MEERMLLFFLQVLKELTSNMGEITVMKQQIGSKMRAMKQEMMYKGQEVVFLCIKDEELKIKISKEEVSINLNQVRKDVSNVKTRFKCFWKIIERRLRELSPR